MDGLDTGRAQAGCHRGGGALLVGAVLEEAFGILSPDPGDRAFSESSVSVPEDPMSVFHIYHEELSLWYRSCPVPV